MKIAFYFMDSGFCNLDLRYPMDGNNGVGGTQYCFLTVGYLLAQDGEHDITFYHYNSNQLPNGIRSKIITDIDTLLESATDDGIDILIFKAEKNIEFIKKIGKTSLKTIAWAHNYIFADELVALATTKQVTRIVFVGKEQYDRYIDHQIIKKSTFIYNTFDGKRFAIRPLPQTPAVTYTGSLVKAKGFHILAGIWKDVLREVPDAQLYVIGSGRLYDRKANLGELGVADKKYEDLFMPFLTQDRELLPSVHFCGNMGLEKLEIYRKTTVGVMNPSGRTETFGLSAVEMEACGIPVVTKKINGLFDTVVSGKTGYLIKSNKDLTRRLIELLKNKNLNNTMGKNAKRFVEESFAPELVLAHWKQLFEEIEQGKQAKYLPATKNYFNNAKWVRIVIRSMKEHGLPAIPLVDVECKFKHLLRRK